VTRAVATPISVLAFADVRDSLVAAARVHAPLEALKRVGLIADYTVTDATLRGAPRGGQFDVVWLQRGADACLARTISTRLAGAYLLDVDDHLLCRPAYLEPRDMPDRAALVAALAGCRVLTTPSSQLAQLLAVRSGLELADRAIACPNAVPFAGAPAVDPSRPAAILLTQGHRLALTDSAEAVLTAIAHGAARHKLPIWALGAPVPLLREAAADARVTLSVLRPRTWAEYHVALSGPPTFLGVAPLETRGDLATLEFVSGKSDVKMVEFGGFGHPGVYSLAAPYGLSDISCGRLTHNDYDGWAAAIDEIMADGWRAAGDEAIAVRARRELDRVAVERWWPAVQAARLEEPIRGASIFGEIDRARARLRDRVARVRWRLMGKASRATGL
jgi:hypothetical protein